MCFLAIWTSSFKKFCSVFFTHFFIGSLIFGEFSFEPKGYKWPK
jgi:hypothetical protein